MTGHSSIQEIDIKPADEELKKKDSEPQKKYPADPKTRTSVQNAILHKFS